MLEAGGVTARLSIIGRRWLLPLLLVLLLLSIIVGVESDGFNADVVLLRWGTVIAEVSPPVSGYSLYRGSLADVHLQYLLY